MKVNKLNLNQVSKLYPQYQRTQDRRQQDIPVAVDRRSGLDRRNQDRIHMDTKLQQDIFQVKSKVNELETIAPKLFEKNITTQTPTFASLNNMTQDTFVKEAKQENSIMVKKAPDLKEEASTSFKIGVIAAALACAIGLSFLSSTGVVIAIGTGIYVGSRILKTLIAKETQETQEVNNNEK